MRKFGLIHILVANHGIFPIDDTFTWDMTLQQFKNTLEVNLVGTFLFCKEFLKQLKNHVQNFSFEELNQVDGCVVIIGSTAGKFGEAGHIDYSSSKSALIYGFTRSLKNEIVTIIPRGRVNGKFLF